jgi:hypothetical protein
VDEGVNIPPRGQSLLLGAKFTPGGKLMLLKTVLRKPFLKNLLLLSKEEEELTFPFTVAQKRPFTLNFCGHT